MEPGIRKRTALSISINEDFSASQITHLRVPPMRNRDDRPSRLAENANNYAVKLRCIELRSEDSVRRFSVNALVGYDIKASSHKVRRDP